MDNFREEIGLVRSLLKRILKAKSIVTIIVIGLVGIFIWRNSDFITKVSFTISNDKQTEVNSNTKKGNSVDTEHQCYNIDFGEIIIPPKSNTLPSVIVFEIKNTGGTALNNIHIGVDLGNIKAIRYEIVGGEVGSTNIEDKNSSVLSFDIKKLQPKNSLYLHIMAESPTFKKVIINADNLAVTKELDYEDYILDKKKVDNLGIWKWPLYLVNCLICLGIFFLIVYLLKSCIWGIFGINSKR